MKFRTTLFFIGLFAVVLGIYLSQSRHASQVMEQEKSASDDFKVQVEEKMPFDKKEKINFIQVQELSRDETFWLEKQESSWKIVYPVRALADQSMVFIILEQRSGSPLHLQDCARFTVNVSCVTSEENFLNSLHAKSNKRIANLYRPDSIKS